MQLHEYYKKVNRREPLSPAWAYELWNAHVRELEDARFRSLLSAAFGVIIALLAYPASFYFIDKHPEWQYSPLYEPLVFVFAVFLLAIIVWAGVALIGDRREYRQRLEAARKHAARWKEEAGISP